MATGAVRPPVTKHPRCRFGGIYTLRSLADADAIVQAVEQGKRGVVIGASFIGMEVAASLAGGRGVSIGAVAPESVPFDRVLGDEIGRMFQREHEANGIQFHLGDGVTGFTGKGAVSSVQLKSGKTLEADFVVVGVGVAPATGFLRGYDSHPSGRKRRYGAAGIHIDPQTDIYAAGDIARWGEGSGTRIEHRRVAEQQGIIAANNMIGHTDVWASIFRSYKPPNGG